MSSGRTEGFTAPKDVISMHYRAHLAYVWVTQSISNCVRTMIVNMVLYLISHSDLTVSMIILAASLKVFLGDFEDCFGLKFHRPFLTGVEDIDWLPCVITVACV